MDLAIELRDAHKIDVKAIKKIHVEVAQGAYDVLAGGSYGPKTECRTKEQVKSKFDRLTGPRLDKGLKAEISAAAQNITTIPVKDLTELLGRVSRPQEQ